MKESKHTIDSFQDLEVWKQCRKLRIAISNQVKTFPNEEKYRLTDQLIRASRSATANIAEGFGRFHFQENIQYCRQARGSLYEIIDHLLVAEEEKLIAANLVHEIIELTQSCIRLSNGYINYLVKAKANMVRENQVAYKASPTDNH